ncbi:MAG: glycosyltransferase [Ferruginibacter sp.]
MITYNHKSYIRQAVESIMMQQTDFAVELFIGDDNSTDGTTDICNELVHEYPGRINLTVNSVNIGPSENAINIFRKCSGAKYIAICEGDDYWCDEYKLQKQVDFLEANDEYAICFHEVMVLRENGQKEFYNNIEVNKSFNVVDLAHNNFIATVSCLFRVYDHFKIFPTWYKGFAGNDYGLKLLNATKGEIYYIKDCMAVYRVHNGGIWSSQTHTEMYENGIKVIDSLNEAFNFEYNEQFEIAKKLRHERFYPQQNIMVEESEYARLKSKLKDYLSKIGLT